MRHDSLEDTKVCSKCRSATGIDWQLDHVVPIAGRAVCGLHVALNLQLLPAVLNNRKRNKHNPQTFDVLNRGLFQGVTV